MAIPTHFALLAVAPGLAALRLLLLAVAAALTWPRPTSFAPHSFRPNTLLSFVAARGRSWPSCGPHVVPTFGYVAVS